MDRGKYIIYDDFRTSDTPILFPCFVEHSRIAEGLKVLSAGEFNLSIKDGKLKVWAGGKSVSLGIESREEDAEIIKRFLTRNGRIWTKKKKKNILLIQFL